ncbi:hypothetical protein EUGRSUZ_H01322, partial [Eucalyptus grandis]
MGGNNRQKKSSSSFCFTSLFEHRRPRWILSSRKIYPSDYDKGQYIAELGIDKKATVFVAKFHQTRALEPE